MNNELLKRLNNELAEENENLSIALIAFDEVSNNDFYEIRKISMMINEKKKIIAELESSIKLLEGIV